MTIEPWVMTLLVSLAAVGLTAAAFVLGRRKEREGKIEKEATERTEVREALKWQSDKLNQMDRNIGDKLSRMEGQYAGMNTCVQDHEQRLVRVEESTKSAHKRIDEIKLKEE